MLCAAFIRSTNALSTSAKCHARRGLAARPRRRAIVVQGHPRNAFAGSYDFDALVASNPRLSAHVIAAADAIGRRDTVDWGDPRAVLELNRALLASDYGVGDWSLPPRSLCPPVPSRADYVHHVADVLATSGGLAAPRADAVGLDAGRALPLIYPLLGHGAYGWRPSTSGAQSASAAASSSVVDAVSPTPTSQKTGVPSPPAKSASRSRSSK
ncbi:23S rRNA (adenine(1618)-N(6))-methyltransferase [Aureococcus anophagefferens]|nr:23S rRNA (adenine(1618)-N(6))-methyltransferase [Aureococcus anophagefferens]